VVTNEPGHRYRWRTALGPHAVDEDRLALGSQRRNRVGRVGQDASGIGVEWLVHQPDDFMVTHLAIIDANSAQRQVGVRRRGRERTKIAKHHAGVLLSRRSHHEGKNGRR